MRRSHEIWQNNSRNEQHYQFVGESRERELQVNNMEMNVQEKEMFIKATELQTIRPSSADWNDCIEVDDDILWVPTQEEMWDMYYRLDIYPDIYDCDIGLHLALSDLIFFLENHSRRGIGSMNELLLRFVMSRCFGKEWSCSEWVDATGDD